jgi:hypothetical protein
MGRSRAGGPRSPLGRGRSPFGGGRSPLGRGPYLLGGLTIPSGESTLPVRENSLPTRERPLPVRERPPPARGNGPSSVRNGGRSRVLGSPETPERTPSMRAAMIRGLNDHVPSIRDPNVEIEPIQERHTYQRSCIHGIYFDESLLAVPHHHNSMDVK